MSRRPRPPQLRALVAADDLRHVAYGPAPVTLRRQLRARVVAEAENRPGVYRLLGATGLVLYVGKSSRLRTRLPPPGLPRPGADGRSRPAHTGRSRRRCPLERRAAANSRIRHGPPRGARR